MNKTILFIKRVSFVLFPLFIVSFMSKNEWVARSQMIDNNIQKNIVYNTVVFMDNSLHPKNDKYDKYDNISIETANIEKPIIEKTVENKEILKVNNIKVQTLKSNEEISKENVSNVKSIENSVENNLVKEEDGNFKRILLIGDSLMSEVAFGLKDQVSKSISLKDIHKSSTGLTNKDYYDWDSVAYNSTLSYSPDLVFIHMGGNDGQDMKVGNKFIKLYTKEWEENYYNRVLELMASIKRANHNSKIVWIGLPGMRNAKYEKKTAIIREIQKQGALDSKIEFLDAGDAIGHTYIKQEKINGKMLDLRRKDGIHYSRDGGEQIATFIIDRKNIKKL